MNDQPRCKPGKSTPWLPDRRCDQAVPPGTVAWRAPAPTLAAVAPRPSRASIARGADRFARTCAACHGPLGDGRSVVARDMVLRPPPSLLVPPVLGYDDRRLYEVITAGYGVMPPYAYQLPPDDRWAVVHYLRVLQRSQRAVLAELPAVRRQEAERWLR
jgi:mono/diheme cytochrome c family protein